MQLLAHLQDSPSAFFQEHPILFLGSVMSFLRSEAGEDFLKRVTADIPRYGRDALFCVATAM